MYSRNVPSGCVRWKLTVMAAPFATMPFTLAALPDSYAVAPAMPVYQLTFGEFTLRMRSIDHLTSEGRTARLTGGEKRTPERRWNV